MYTLNSKLQQNKCANTILIKHFPLMLRIQHKHHVGSESMRNSVPDMNQ